MRKQGIQKGDSGYAQRTECRPNGQGFAQLPSMIGLSPAASQKLHAGDYGPERVGRPIESAPGKPGHC